MAIAPSPSLDVESLRRALTGQVFAPEDDRIRRRPETLHPRLRRCSPRRDRTGG